MTHFSDRLAESILRRRSAVCVGIDPDLALLPDDLRASYAATRRASSATPQPWRPASPSLQRRHRRRRRRGRGDQAAGGLLRAVRRRRLGCPAARRGLRPRARAAGDRRRQARRHRLDLAPPTPPPCSAARRPWPAHRWPASAPTPSPSIPYLGDDSLAPFVERCAQGKGVFVLTRTSNPGAAVLQETDCDGRPLYLRVDRHGRAARRGLTWARTGTATWGRWRAPPPPRRSRRARRPAARLSAGAGLRRAGRRPRGARRARQRRGAGLRGQRFALDHLRLATSVAATTGAPRPRRPSRCATRSGASDGRPHDSPRSSRRRSRSDRRDVAAARRRPVDVADGHAVAAARPAPDQESTSVLVRRRRGRTAPTPRGSRPTAAATGSDRAAARDSGAAAPGACRAPAARAAAARPGLASSRRSSCSSPSWPS